MMKKYIQNSADAAAEKAAQLIGEYLNEVLSKKPIASIAFSGGRSPIQMFKHLVEQDIDWARVEIFQVDERIAPAGDTARNLTALQQHLFSRVDIPDTQVHAMPVETNNITTSLDEYATRLKTSAGDPPRLDIIHLGLGDDGHTASLPPGDNVLNSKQLVDICEEFNDYRRMTLTYPVLNMASAIVWLVTGADKQPMLDRLLAGDTQIPAGRVNQAQAILVADKAAGAQL